MEALSAKLWEDLTVVGRVTTRLSISAASWRVMVWLGRKVPSV